MIYAYIRVSTDKQTVENQRFEIENYCRKRQIDVDQYIEETISGMKDVAVMRVVDGREMMDVDVMADGRR